MQKRITPMWQRILLLIAVVVSWSATEALPQFQTQRDGAWSEPSTWVNGQVPPSGSQVVVSHQVTLGSKVRLSARALSEPSLTITRGAELILEMRADLELAGDLKLINGSLTATPGSRLSFTQQVTESARAIMLSEQAKISFAGTQESRCELRSSPTSPKRVTLSLEIGAGSSFEMVGCMISQFGDAQAPAIELNLEEQANLLIAQSQLKQNGRLKTSGFIPSDASFLLAGNIFEESFGELSAELSAYNSQESGTRLIFSNAFDKSVHLYPARDFQIRQNIFLDGISAIPAEREFGWLEFRDNVIQNPTTKELLLAGDSLNNYWLIDLPAEVSDENPHFVQALSFSSMEINGDIFEYTGSDGNGDAIIVGEPPAPATLTIKNVIVLPNRANESSGTLFSALGSPNVSIVAEHNTYFTGSQGAAVGETYPGHPGLVQSFRSNIAWDTASRGFALFDSGIDEQVMNLVAADSLSHNVSYQLLGAYSGLEFSGNPGGRSDQEIDPQFVDPRRDISSWNESLGGPGTARDALVRLTENVSSAQNEPLLLMTFIREGFRPQNQVLSNSAHDGRTRGAVSFSAPQPAIPLPAPFPLPDSLEFATSSEDQEPSVDGLPSLTPQVATARKAKVKRKKGRVILVLERYPEAQYLVKIFKRGKGLYLEKRSQRPKIGIRKPQRGRFRISYSVTERTTGMLLAESSPRTFRIRRKRNR